MPLKSVTLHSRLDDYRAVTDDGLRKMTRFN